jgi:hypothetical protein
MRKLWQSCPQPIPDDIQLLLAFRIDTHLFNPPMGEASSHEPNYSGQR